MVDIIVLEPETGQQKTYVVPVPSSAVVVTSSSESSGEVEDPVAEFGGASFERERIMELLRLVVWHLALISGAERVVEEGELD